MNTKSKLLLISCSLLAAAASAQTYSVGQCAIAGGGGTSSGGGYSVTLTGGQAAASPKMGTGFPSIGWGFWSASMVAPLPLPPTNVLSLVLDSTEPLVIGGVVGGPFYGEGGGGWVMSNSGPSTVSWALSTDVDWFSVP